MGSTPAYASEYLVPTMLTGAGVGLSFASWGSAAVAELPPARFATGSAVLACVRQIGAVLGIAALIAVLDAAPPGDPLSGFVDAWTLMAVAGGVVATLALTLGRVARARARAGMTGPRAAAGDRRRARPLAPPIAALMGFEPVEAEEGRVVFEATPTDATTTTRSAAVHGGFAATLLDSAMGCAVHSTLPDGVGYTTLELKVNFTRAITGRHRPGRLRGHGSSTAAAAWRRPRGGSSPRESGKLLAHGTTTCLILDGEPG